MADVELLPCPFCGSAPRFYSEDGKAVCVLCGECGASSDFWHADHADHDAKAASAWNTRAHLAPLHAENERLAEVLRLHIEDLERSAVVLDRYPAMAPTAAEMRKAAAELRAALHPTAAQAAENERLRVERDSLRRLVQERDAMLGRRLCSGVNADGKPRCLTLAEANARADRLAEALRECVENREGLAYESELLARIDALLNPTAALAQEDRND